MRRYSICAVVALLLLGHQATAGGVVGGVSSIKGECTGVLGGRSEPLALRSTVVLQQEVATAPAARLEITFDDSTRLTMGERARLTIDEFVYSPGGKNRIAFAVTGAMRFVSAQGKPADSDVDIVTPVATIGVRGTDFWTGPIDGQFGVLLLEGAVVVTNPSGEVVLDEPGEGVNIAAPGAAPGLVTLWPQDKVARALAAVAF